jgi:predicted DNA-binding transcriptional regulator YafY
MEQTICTAIKSRRLISFTYKNQMRVVEPYILGYGEDDDLVLSAWQVSGLRPDWRRFLVTKATFLSATEENFEGTRRGYNRNDPSIPRKLCRF